MDQRKRAILSAIVKEYIKTGEPVGSKNIVTAANLSVSSATIRNDMAMLEKLGFLEQPYTSAGRIPTYLGYRLYIEKLMQPHVLTSQEKNEIGERLCSGSVTAENLLDHAAGLLSDLTELMVVNANHTMHFSVIARVEVIPTGRKLYALLMITSSGTIKNKVCRLEFELTHEQIGYFADLVNQHVQGICAEQLTPAMLQSLAVALGSYLMALLPLLHAVFELGKQLSEDQLNICGKEKLFIDHEINHHEVQRIVNSKHNWSQLLTDSFSGIKVIFGQENAMLAVTNLSMIVSPYHIGEEMQGGTLGVIGPMRLDYAKVISYMEYFSERVAGLLSDMLKGNEES